MRKNYETVSVIKVGKEVYDCYTTVYNISLFRRRAKLIRKIKRKFIEEVGLVPDSIELKEYRSQL